MLPDEILQGLADNLNISKVIAFLHELSSKAKNNVAAKKQLLSSLDFLGLIDVNFFDRKTNLDENYINAQIELRFKYRQEKNFAKADEVRNGLLTKGIILEDIAKDKTIWKIQ